MQCNDFINQCYLNVYFVNYQALLFLDPSHRIKRSADKSLWQIIKQIKNGMEKIVDGYVFYTLRGINSAINKKRNASRIIDKIVSDAVADIDNRLNNPTLTEGLV